MLRDVCQLHGRVRLFVTPWTVAHQAPLSMGFSRQGYWSGLPFPFPGDLPDPGICHLTTLREKSTHWWRLQPSGEPLGEGRDGTPSKELHEDKNFLNTKTLIWKGAQAPVLTKTLIWKGAQAPVLSSLVYNCQYRGAT